MKILIIRNYPSYMAVTNGTYNIQEVGLAKALVRKGHQCDILFWTDRQEEVIQIPVDDAGTIQVFYKKGISALKNVVYTGCDKLFRSYDILQSSEYNHIQSWVLAGKYPQKTVIYHGPYACDFNKRYNLMCKVFDAFFLKRYLKKGTHFMAKSDLAKEFLLSKGIKDKNIAVTGVGMDSQMLSSPKGSCDQPLYHAMQADNGLKLLYIGRLEPRRNIPFLVDVFRAVVECESNVTLYIIGTGDAEYKASVFARIEEYGLKDKVIWQEKMEQKYLSYIYSQADFFLLPTIYEIFGMVLLEAMYYGNVVLTTPNGGSSMLIRNGENGLVLEDATASQWAEAVVSCAKDRNAMRKIQTCASQSISEKFTWDSICALFEKQYEIVVK